MFIQGAMFIPDSKVLGPTHLLKQIDDVLMTTLEQEDESQRQKKTENPALICF